MATTAVPQRDLNQLDFDEYIVSFLDAHPDLDALDSAAAIGAQIKGEFGPCDTHLVELLTIAAFNRREDRRRGAEWTENHQAAYGFAAGVE